MSDVSTVVALIALGTGVHAVYSSAELLSVRRQYDDSGLMSWAVVSIYIDDILGSSVVKPFLNHFVAVLVARAAAGTALVGLVVFGRRLAAPDVVLSGVVFVLLLSDVLIVLRHPAGLSGAFDMSLVTNAGLLVATAFPDGSVEQLAGLLFIAVQGILGYLLAGVAKAVGEQWRTGTAVEMIFSTKTWGDDRLSRLVQSFPRTKYLFAWSVIGFEILLPLVLFVDPPTVFVVFGLGFVFHFANAAVMGINSFMLMFPATYPAIYYANQLIPWSVL